MADFEAELSDRLGQLALAEAERNARISDAIGEAPHPDSLEEFPNTAALTTPNTVVFNGVMAKFTPLQALEKAVEVAGSQQALAEALGKQHQSYVSEMLRRLRKGRKIPVEICPGIEAATAGTVTRQMLRPDFRWTP